MAEDIFAKRLRDTREDSDISREELGRALDVSKSAIATYESGQNDVRSRHLATLCKKLNVSADYLLGLDSRVSIPVGDLTSEEIELVQHIVSYIRSKKA